MAIDGERQLDLPEQCRSCPIIGDLVEQHDQLSLRYEYLRGIVEAISDGRAKILLIEIKDSGEIIDNPGKDLPEFFAIMLQRNREQSRRTKDILGEILARCATTGIKCQNDNNS